MADKIKSAWHNIDKHDKARLAGFVSGCILRLIVRVIFSSVLSAALLKLGMNGGFFMSSVIFMTSYSVSTWVLHYYRRLLENSCLWAIADRTLDLEHREETSALLDIGLALVEAFAKTTNDKDS